MTRVRVMLQDRLKNTPIMLASIIFKFSSWHGKIESLGELEFLEACGESEIDILTNSFGYESQTQMVKVGWKRFKKWIIHGTFPVDVTSIKS